MICVERTCPPFTRLTDSVPAATEACTSDTSPRTITVTRPLPIFS